MSDTPRIVRTLLKILILSVLAMAGSILTAGHFNTAEVSAAVCGSEPVSTTGKSTQTITVPATDTYTIWSRMKAPSTSPVEYQVYLAGECFTVGQTGLTAGTLTWVDYENGSTVDKATIDLAAGTHTLVLTAGTEDLELDRVMLLSDSCAPTGTGDNCLNDTTLPTTSITSPTEGVTVSATTAIQASATDNDAIDYVEFYRDGTTLLGTDSVAPYSYNWDTTTASDGAHSLTVRAYDLSTNTQTSSAVNVTVNNAPPVNADIASFSAVPSTITDGQSSTLSWTVNTGTACTIDQGVGGVALTGSQVVSPTTTTTYTLSCSGQNGGISDTAQTTVTVNPAPVVADIATFTATPSTITTGQSSTLAWTVNAGQACTIDQGVGAVAANGNQSVSPTVTTTYTLTCQGLNGGASDSAQATVIFDTSPVNAVISSFTASPSTIIEGQSSTLAWSVSAGTNCTIDQSIGAVSATGNQSVSPASTITYTLTCDGLNGGTNDTATATLTVNPAPVNANISSFTASPSTIIEGQSSTLAWTVATGQNCSIDQAVGAVALSGSQSVSPVATTTYTLTCQGLNGGASDTESVALTVNPAPVNANISSFTATPSTINAGQSSVLQWSVSAGQNCSIDQSVGAVSLSGTQSVSPTANTTYTLTCQGANGGSSDSANATLTVNTPVNASITALTADPLVFTPAQSVTLTWSASTGENCSIDQSVGAVSLTGTQSVSPTANTTYTLTCQGIYGGAAATRAVEVRIDSDSDGVADLEETGDTDAGPSDELEPSVVNILNAKTVKYNTLKVTGDCAIFGSAKSSNKGGAKVVQGVWSFTLTCPSPGQSATVDIYLDKVYDTSAWEVIKNNDAFNDPKDITDQVTFTTAAKGSKTVTVLRYVLVDGGELDQDGVANGTIIDPVAIEEVLGTSTGGDLAATGISLPGTISVAVAIILASIIAAWHYAKQTSNKSIRF